MCPNKHGNYVTTSISSLFRVAILREYSFCINTIKKVKNQNNWSSNFQNVVYHFCTCNIEKFNILLDYKNILKENLTKRSQTNPFPDRLFKISGKVSMKVLSRNWLKFDFFPDFTWFKHAIELYVVIRKIEIYLGSRIEIYLGSRIEIYHGSRIEIYLGSRIEIYLGSRIELYLGSRIEIYPGSRKEIYLGSRIEIYPGSRIDIYLGSRIEIYLGSRIEIYPGSWIDISRFKERDISWFKDRDISRFKDRDISRFKDRDISRFKDRYI